MLVFALMLIAGGLVAAVSLIAFLAENLLALLCAALAGHAALTCGGGWPGAAVVAATTYAFVASGLRIAIGLAPSPGLRMLLAALVVIPAALFTFGLAGAALWPFVPDSTWRTGLALIAAMAAAIGACRRLWTLPPAA